MNKTTKVLFVFGIGAITLWCMQYGIQKVLNSTNHPVHAQKMGYSQTETERIVTDAFAAISLQSPPMGESFRNDSSDIQNQILENLRASGIELYVLERPEIVRWRIYNKDSLQYQISFSKVAPLPTEDPASTTLSVNRKTPVALVITGTKYKDLEPMLNLDVPLNLALEPTSPFGLRNAVLGAQNWHEIVLDIRNSSEFVLDAIPFATSLLSSTTLPIDTMNVISEADTEVITTATIDFPQGKIWQLDMTSLTTQEVKKWIDSLPETIHFVRISYWDIAPE